MAWKAKTVPVDETSTVDDTPTPADERRAQANWDKMPAARKKAISKIEADAKALFDKATKK